ncbi:hypothetical protein AAVH_31868, partial [Aphelenchoides avenae]
LVATMDAAGYRQTSQCCGCRSHVPNRRLHWCLTCATEVQLPKYTITNGFKDPVTLCADCALHSHKDHDLTPFVDEGKVVVATRQAPSYASSPTAVVVVID